MMEDVLESLLATEASKDYTENGAIVFNTSGNRLTDFFGKIGNLRNDEVEAVRVFERAFDENPIAATRLLFYARDCRGGQGERRAVFHIFYKFFYEKFPQYGKQLIKYFAEYGRWKDLFDILSMSIKNKDFDSDIHEVIFDTIYHQLMNDYTIMVAYQRGDLLEKPSISMLAKWMPSCHSKSPNVRALFKWFSNRCKVTGVPMGEEVYRKKYLKPMREFLDIVEHKIVNKEYDKIDYTKIPSRALKRYQTLFINNDYERFNEVMKKAANPEENPEVKLNVRQLYPHEIIGKLDWYGFYKGNDANDALWYQMPNFFKREVSILPVLDTSGSMSSPMINNSIAASLAIYTAQRNSHKTFRNYIMQFSSKPHLVSIEGLHSLTDIINSFKCDNSSTNFEGVMNYLLSLAIKNNIPQEEMPEYLMIISDMQFDGLAEVSTPIFDNGFNPDKYVKIPMMEALRKRYEEYGYKLPMMIYWNVDENPNVKGQFPMEHRDGCIYISGKSPVIFEHLFDEKFPTTLDLIKQIVNSDRYKKINIEFN